VNLRERTPEPVAAAPLPRSEPNAAAAPGAHPQGHGDDMVDGVSCSRGHFNDPRARYCYVCGIAMFQASVVLTKGRRPSLGVLVFGEGSTAALDRTLVVGREPETHPDVIGRRANALPIQDATQSVSRVHALVRLDGWDAHAVDLGSTNGTFVWQTVTQQWLRLIPNQAHRLEPGARVAFGKVTCIFESSLQQA
jgi:hypothetical protein